MPYLEDNLMQETNFDQEVLDSVGTLFKTFPDVESIFDVIPSDFKYSLSLMACVFDLEAAKTQEEADRLTKETALEFTRDFGSVENFMNWSRQVINDRKQSNLPGRLDGASLKKPLSAKIVGGGVDQVVPVKQLLKELINVIGTPVEGKKIDLSIVFVANE
jgi:hypothetical protein